MSLLRDPRLIGSTPTLRSALRTAGLDARVSTIERGGPSGGSVISSGAVSDATTTVKGKLKLAGHLAGSADTPTIATTAQVSLDKLTITGTGSTFLVTGTPYRHVHIHSSTVDGRSLEGASPASADNRGTSRLFYNPTSFTNMTNGPFGDDTRVNGALVTGYSGQFPFHSVIGNWNYKGGHEAFRAIVQQVTAHTAPPMNYTEVVPFICRMEGCNSRGAYVGNWESWIQVNDVATGGADAGPAKAFGAMYQMYEKNAYSAYDDAGIFGASTSAPDWRTGGSRCFWAWSSGTEAVGTGMYLQGIGGFKRAIVYQDPAGMGRFGVDGEGRIGVNRVTNQTIALGASLTIGYDNTGAVATTSPYGISFGNHAFLYSHATNWIRTDTNLSVGATCNVAGPLNLNAGATGTTGYMQFGEITTDPGSASGQVMLYALDDGAGTTILKMRTTAGITTIGGGGADPLQLTGLGLGVAPNVATARALFVAGTTAADGINFGGDVALYRVAADVLYSPDQLGVGSTTSAGAGGDGVHVSPTGRLDVTRSSSALMFRHYDTSIGSSPITTLGNGTGIADGLRFGAGTASTTLANGGVGIWRSASQTMRCDGNFVTAGTATAVTALISQGTLAVTGVTTAANSVQLTHTTGGGFIQFLEQSSAVNAPGTEAGRLYIRNNKLVASYNDGGTTRWYYLTLTDTATNPVWTYSATDPA